VPGLQVCSSTWQCFCDEIWFTKGESSCNNWLLEMFKVPGMNFNIGGSERTVLWSVQHLFPFIRACSGRYVCMKRPRPVCWNEQKASLDALGPYIRSDVCIHLKHISTCGQVGYPLRVGNILMAFNGAVRHLMHGYPTTRHNGISEEPHRHCVCPNESNSYVLHVVQHVASFVQMRVTRNGRQRAG